MKQPKTFAHFLKELFQVVVLTTLVGIALSFMLATPLQRSLTYSLAIGLNIFLLAWAMAFIHQEKRKSVSVFAISIPLGSITGIVLGSYLLGTSPLQLLEQQPQVLLTTSVAAIVFGIVISYYFYARSRIVEGQHQLQAESLSRAHHEQRLTETELRLLQAQIEPHFLFNTLSNVVSLIDNDPQRAKKMLVDFTQYLRASLQRTRSQTTTLGQEVTLLNAYLAIQTVRMGKRLNYHIDMPADLEQIAFPPLMIQPLVENAIQHGLEPTLEGGNVHIKAWREASQLQKTDQLIVEVLDTGRGLQADGGSGVGLNNIRQRLSVLYGDKGCLRISENPPHGVKARLMLPLSPVLNPEKMP